MKKLILTLTLGIGMMSITSCRWIHETFYSVEGCTEWYYEEIYEASAQNDTRKVIKRIEQCEEWCKNMTFEDRCKAGTAADIWEEANPRKAKIIFNFLAEKQISW